MIELSDRPSVIVVGAINVDIVVVAPTLPGPGETVVGAGVRRNGGGKGANAAVAASDAGARTCLIGAVGDDEDGRLALAELADRGVDVSEVRRLPGTSTGTALIVVDAHGENQIAVGSGANLALTADEVAESMARLLTRAGAVLVSTEIAPAAVLRAVQLSRQAGVRCVLNPAPVLGELREVLAGPGPIVTPNQSELAELARLLGVAPDEPAESLAAAVHSRTGAAVVVTLGSSGALVVSGGGPAVAIPATFVDVVDTTGAGDAFNGVFVARLAAGDPVEAAARAATEAASRSVTRPGARG